MSGSTTPVSSTASYSDADVRAQSVWQAEVNKLKVAQLDELLNAKGVKPRGVKAEKAMEVAWRYTKEEITEWRAKQETLTPPAILIHDRSFSPAIILSGLSWMYTASDSRSSPERHHRWPKKAIKRQPV